MTIETIHLEPLFFLYCALLYNNNGTVVYTSRLAKLKDEIVEFLEEIDYPKIDMPHHRYQYLKSLLNSPNYEPTNRTNPAHIEIIEYIKKVSEIEDLQDLFTIKAPEVEELLQKYQNIIPAVKRLFEEHFDFVPHTDKFLITRNWGRSGMCIPTPKANYIIVGWNSNNPNIRNIIHEICHTFIDLVDITIEKETENSIRRIPEYLKNNYRKEETLVKESLVRALVVYLTELEPEMNNEELSEDDFNLVLPEVYLKRLRTEKRKVLSLKYLEKIVK